MAFTNGWEEGEEGFVKEGEEEFCEGGRHAGESNEEARVDCSM